MYQTKNYEINIPLSSSTNLPHASSKVNSIFIIEFLSSFSIAWIRSYVSTQTEAGNIIH